VIRAWAASRLRAPGPIEVYGLSDVIAAVRTAAASKTYRDNPVLVTMKVVNAAGLLVATDTSTVGDDVPGNARRTRRRDVAWLSVSGWRYNPG
jgi:hypothetical protein